MGKNTMMRYCVEKYLEETGDTRWECLVKPGRKGLLEGNVGIVFTNGDLSQVRPSFNSQPLRAQRLLTLACLGANQDRGCCLLSDPRL